MLVYDKNRLKALIPAYWILIELIDKTENQNKLTSQLSHWKLLELEIIIS